MNTERPLHTFTLIELLLVVAVIAILAGMLLPALNAAKEKARTIACASNQKQCSLELLLYAEDSQGTIPPYYYNSTTKWGKTDQKEGNWFVILVDRPFWSDAVKKRWKYYNCPSLPFRPEYNSCLLSYDTQIFGLISACSGGQFNIQKKKLASTANTAYRYSDNDLERPVSELPMLADSSIRIGSIGQRRQASSIHNRYKYENSSSIHLRHPGNSANITFLDGHLENQNKGSVISKNVFRHWILKNVERVQPRPQPVRKSPQRAKV